MSGFWSKSYSIDKSAAASTICWWQATVASIPQPQWNTGSKQEHLAKPFCRSRRGAETVTAGNSDTQDELWQNGDCSVMEQDSGSGSGLAADRRSTLNRTSSSIRNQDVTASSDKLAERSSNVQMQYECPSNAKTPTCTTESCRFRPRVDTLSLETGRTDDQTIGCRQRSDQCNITAMSTPVSSHQESQNSPSISRTDNVVHRAIESMVTTGNYHLSPAHGERPPRSGTQSSSTEQDTNETTSILSDGKRITPEENKIDQMSTYMFNVHPSISAATKPNYITNATFTAKTAVTKAQPTVAETSSRPTPAQTVRAEKNFGTNIAKPGSEATTGVDISVRNSAANGDRTADKKLPFDGQSFVSSSSTKPAIARIIKKLYSHSQDFPSATADKILTTPTTSTDDVRPTSVKDAEAVISGTSADTVLTARKHAGVSAVLDNENKPANSSTTEQASSISETSRVLNTIVSSSSNDSGSIDTASVEAGSATTNVVDPLAVKLVRVDHMLRSVPPVAPANIRSTGVATPAVQAQKLANVKHATTMPTSHLPTSVQTESRSLLTTTKKHIQSRAV